MEEVNPGAKERKNLAIVKLERMDETQGMAELLKSESNDASSCQRCTICFKFTEGSLPTSTAESSDSDKTDDLPVPTTSFLYKVLRITGVPSNIKVNENETKLPLCPLCEGSIHEAKKIFDQIEEMEKTLKSLAKDMKEKLVNSVEESRIQDWKNMCNIMIDVIRIRTEMMKCMEKKKPGRPKRKIKDDNKSINEDKVDEQKEETKRVEPEDKIVAKECRTSRGRIVKRPQNFFDTINPELVEAKTLESNEELAVYLDPLDNIEANEIKPELEEDLDTPDPEWSPGLNYEEEMEELSSSGEGSDLESTRLEEGIEGNSKETISKLPKSRSSKMKNKKKREGTKRKVHNFNAASTSSKHRKKAEEVIKIPIKVAGKDGEFYDGVYMDKEQKTDKLGNTKEDPIFTLDMITKVESGSFLSLEEIANMKTVRLKCTENNCSRTFVSLDSMKVHIQRMHSNENSNPTPSTVYFCEHCDESFKKLRHLKIHTKEIHPDVPIKSVTKQVHLCSFEGCQRSYCNPKELKIHIRAVHTGEKPYKCDSCEECFVSLMKKEFHIETVHPEIPPLKCEFCPRAFFRQHRLREHIISHTGEKRYLCDLCGKSFSQPAYLRYHQTQHAELLLEPYKCVECDKKFASPVNLRIHRKTQHLKDYRYRCEICNHGANHTSHLRLHMRTHSGERPYPCNVCEKTFTRGSQLTIHLRSHTGERPYRCKDCDKTFTNSSKLRRHENVHSSEKRFKCSLCQKGFSQASNLNSHIKAAHTNKPKEIKRKSMTNQVESQSIQKIQEMFQQHAVFQISEQNLPIQLQVINSSEVLDGSEPYTEYIILNEVS